MIITMSTKYDMGDTVKVKFQGKEHTTKITDIGLEITRRSSRVIYGVNDPDIQTVLEEDVIGLSTGTAIAETYNADSPF